MKIFYACALFLIVCFSSAAHAAMLENDCFKILPVMENGRAEPLAVFAAHKIKLFTLQENFNHRPADDWIAEILFTPEQAASHDFFKLQNTETRRALGLPETQKYSSFQKLSAAYRDRPDLITALSQAENLSAPQIEFLKIYDNLKAFKNIRSDLAANLPIDAATQQKYEKNLNELKTAYLSGDVAAWHRQSCAALDLFKNNPVLSVTRLRLEYLYAHINPLAIAMALYAAALAFSFFAKRPGFIIFCAALGVHGAAILARIIITQRPPVGTLYESILYVSLVAALLSMLLARRSANAALLRAGSLCAIMLLGLAPFFVPETGDMQPLVAVLNTNFWLSTHVICITTGYALCVMTAICAHMLLCVRAFKFSLTRYPLHPRTLHMLSIAALFFTTIGTILGGIWADQSWGRFWGWDPKENGALLIVLWIVWLQHGRVTSSLNEKFYTAGLACLNIIVALAWFGVNLLGTGLHSYGFTQGAFAGLTAFCGGELIIILTLLFIPLTKKSFRHAP